MAFLDCTATVSEDGSLLVSEQARQQLKLHPGNAVTLRIVTTEAPPIESAKPRKRAKVTQKDWEEERQQLADELSKIWPEGVSVTDVLSEMRR